MYFLYDLCIYIWYIFLFLKIYFYFINIFSDIFKYEKKICNIIVGIQWDIKDMVSYK